MNKIRKTLGIPDGLRIGQRIWNQMNKYGHCEYPDADSLYFMSDEELIKVLEIELFDPKKSFSTSENYGEFMKTMQDNGINEDDAYDMWMEFRKTPEEGTFSGVVN